MKRKILVLVLMLFAASLVTGFAQEKPRIGVLRFTNQVAGLYWWHSSVATDLQDMLISELASTRKFAVLERQEINAVISEQDLSASGRVDKKTLVKMGKIKGAKYLIAGTVSAFEKTAAKGGKIRIKGVSLGGKKEKTYIAVDVKLIDSETSEIVDARTIEATIKAKAIGAGLSTRHFSIAGEDAKKTPTGKAIRACLMHIVDYLICSVTKGLDHKCMKKFDEMERRRREKTKGVIDIE